MKHCLKAPPFISPHIRSKQFASTLSKEAEYKSFQNRRVAKAAQVSFLLPKLSAS
jgi:hypothetical protein